MRVRSLDDVSVSGDLPWLAPALEQLRSSANGQDSAPAFLDTNTPVAIARAPGRLDVMGGIADYSGSLVLEMPLACATFAIAQRQDTTRLDLLSNRGGHAFRFDVDLGVVLHGELSSPDRLAAWFAERPEDRWAAYIVGSVYRCLTLAGVATPTHGLRLFITSDVPEGKGVSSSAALEVAVMAAAINEAL